MKKERLEFDSGTFNDPCPPKYLFLYFLVLPMREAALGSSMGLEESN